MSKKINNNLILLGLLVLGIFALVAALSPAPVKAFDYDEWYTETFEPVVDSANASQTNDGKILNIYGKNFTMDSVGKLDNESRDTVYVSPTRLVIELYESDWYPADDHRVTVYNGREGGSSNRISVFLGERQVAVAPIGSTTYSNTNVSANRTTTTNNTTVKKTATTNESEDYSGLTANAFFGTDGFMPSGAVQWLFFIILVMFIVILVRKLFIGNERDNTPLKHA